MSAEMGAGEPHWLWDECGYGETRVTASGVKRDVTLWQQFTISANGQDVEMIVLNIEHPGSRWQAQDLRTYLAETHLADAPPSLPD